jgi:hypothetical protein
VRLIKAENLSADDTLRELLRSYGSKLLTEHIKPYFYEPRVDNYGNKSKQRVASSADEHVPPTLEEQPWKSVKVDCVEILEWILYHIKFPDVAPIQHLILPPILTMIDDYDPIYKTRGIKLMEHTLINNSTPNDLRRTGLGDVLFQVCTLCYLCTTA